MTSSGLLAFSNGARPAPKAFCASSTESFTSIAKTGWRPTTVNRPAIAQMATPPIRVADVRHRTDNGRLADTLANPADQALVVKFLESIDFNTVPFVPLAVRRAGNQLLVSFDSVPGARYAIEAKPTLTASWATVGSSIVGNGLRMEVPVSIGSAAQFLRLVEGQ